MNKTKSYLSRIIAVILLITILTSNASFMVQAADNLNEMDVEEQVEEISMDEIYNNERETLMEKDPELLEETKEVNKNPDYQVITLDKPIPFGEDIEGLSNIGSMSYKQALVIKGTANNLLPTFDDRDQTLENLRVEAADLLAVVQDEYELEPFGQENIQAYAAYSNEYIEMESSRYINWKYEYSLIRNFANMEDNSLFNAILIDYIENTPEPKDSELVSMLPYNCPFVEKYSCRLTRAASDLNVNNAVTYAKKYAVTANSSAYGDLSNGDCANFASQILYAGINRMNDTGNKSTGWWHKQTKVIVSPIQPPVVQIKNDYSYSWTLAEKFVSYMGHSNNKYTSFRTLSDKVTKGDFIAYDQAADGKFDHIGFVTQIGTYNNYKTDSSGSTTKYYRDFVVAQHTSHYERWVSATNNNWEKLEDGKCVFAIVRRNAVA